MEKQKMGNDRIMRGYFSGRFRDNQFAAAQVEYRYPVGKSFVLAAFASAVDAAVHPRLFAVQEQSTVIEAFDKGIQSILIGEATPEQVANEVQAVKEREMSRLAQADANAQHALR